MSDEQDPLVSRLLNDVSKGDRVAGERLMPLVYAELREIALRLFRRERADHTLEPTALVHEAWMKLVDQDRVDWQGRSHFFAVGAQAMRRILVDHARARGRDKRGGNRRAVAFPEDLAAESEGAPDLLDLEQALAGSEVGTAVFPQDLLPPRNVLTCNFFSSRAFTGNLEICFEIVFH